MSVVLFDNRCKFCKKIVMFIKNRDSKKKIRFIALESIEAINQLNNIDFVSNKDSLIFIKNKLAYTYSTAVLKTGKELGGIYSLSYILIFIPKKIRDLLYRIVANNRYRLF